MTRPIVTCIRSVTHGIATWVDRQLQRIGALMPFVIKSSTNMVRQLRLLTCIPVNSRYFTFDAVSMYTNIDTKHALDTIWGWCMDNKPALAILQIQPAKLFHALKIVMDRNVFTFDDTWWLQVRGAAMGTPPACMYATIYFAIFEMKIVKRFPELLYYGRYIDDGIGIWVPQNAYDEQRFTAFQRQIQSASCLDWEFSERLHTLHYLDVTLGFRHGRVTTCMTDKNLSLHLYVSAQSAHPPGVLRGLISGMLLRIFRLTCDRGLQRKQTQTLFDRLRARGYQPKLLINLFRSTLKKITAEVEEYIVLPTTPMDQLRALGWEPKLTATASDRDKAETERAATLRKVCLDTKQLFEPNTPIDDERPLFLHVRYHPLDPSRSDIQQMFRDTMLRPRGIDDLPHLHNNAGRAFNTSRLIVAYHRPNNIGDKVARTRFSAKERPVSQVIDEDHRNGPNLPPHPKPGYPL